MHADEIGPRAQGTPASQSEPWSASDITRSKRIVIAVNVAKLLLLATLAPPVVTGIAERASAISTPKEAAAIVATTASVGALTAIVGALLLPAISDFGRANQLARWLWVIGGTAIGSIGLVMVVMADTGEALTVGWGVAEFGYSGAMAVLRAILASALPDHRRRGAVVAVVGSYAGLLLPLVILIILPSAVWQTTFGLALLSLVTPIFFLVASRRLPVTSPRLQGDAQPRTPAQQPSRDRSPVLLLVMLLLVQLGANAVMSAFLSFHALDIENRVGDPENFPVRASVSVLIAAILGLIVVSVLLLMRPRLLKHARGVLIVGGIILAGSLVLRGASESLVLVTVAAAMSGIAVGLNSSTLLASALEAAPEHRIGRFIGVFSAAGAAGQLVGPLLGLWILNAVSTSSTQLNYPGLFLLLAVLPAAWSVALMVPGRTRDAAAA